MSGKTLVAGVGNIFLGDDGFGSEVARRLMGSGLPDGVRVADYGTSGMHLAYDLSSGYETAILIDASPRGEPPGTVSVLDVDARPGPGPAAPGLPAGAALFDGHGMQPDVVLGMLGMLGGTRAPHPGRLLRAGQRRVPDRAERAGRRGRRRGGADRHGPGLRGSRPPARRRGPGR